MHPELKRWARTHFFRIWTAIATILLLGLLLVYRPELLTWYLRTTMRLIEAAAARFPYPWGDRIEFFLKEIGGHIWIQITLAIVAVRLVTWMPLFCWRCYRSWRKGGRPRIRSDFFEDNLVLPEWIEHSTSPLPRGCSTTELRQQKARTASGGANAAETATSAPVGARQCHILQPH